VTAAGPAIASGDAWGPFAADLDPAERLARLRCLRAIVHLCCGPRGAAAERALAENETDPTRAVEALAAVYAMAPLDKKRVLCTYAALSRTVAA
jgi:hypothetical protein